MSRWTGIPVAKLTESERNKTLHLADALHERVVGQEEGVTKVTEAILRSKAGIKDPGKPIGSFLFMGPTGVVGQVIEAAGHTCGGPVVVLSPNAHYSLPPSMSSIIWLRRAVAPAGSGAFLGAESVLNICRRWYSVPLRASTSSRAMAKAASM